MANQTVPLHNVYGGHVRFPKGPVTVANNFTGGTFTGDNTGTVKQILSKTTRNVWSVGGTTWGNIGTTDTSNAEALGLTITKSAGTSILICTKVSVGHNTHSGWGNAMIRLTKDGNIITEATGTSSSGGGRVPANTCGQGGMFYYSGHHGNFCMAIDYLDDSSATKAATSASYRVQGRGSNYYGGTMYVNRAQDTSWGGGGVSTITLFEME